jgi:hypothetical protein
MAKLTSAQAADYGASLKTLSLDNLNYHIFLLANYGAWSSFTPHKQEIAHNELNQRNAPKAVQS